MVQEGMTQALLIKANAGFVDTLFSGHGCGTQYRTENTRKQI